MPKLPKYLYFFVLALLFLVILLYLLKLIPSFPRQLNPTSTSPPQTKSSTINLKVPQSYGNLSTASSSNYFFTINTQVESTDSGKIKGTATITNTSGSAYADLYLGVLLQSPQTLTPTTINGRQVTQVNTDNLSYSQVGPFAIGSKEVKNIPFEISYSPHLKSANDYRLVSGVVNPLGQYFGISFSSVSLTGTNDLLSINNQNCTVVVNGQSYFPTLAPLAEKNSLVYGQCSVINPTSQTLNLKYQVSYGVLHNLFYPQSPKLQQRSTETINIGPNQTTSIRFNLPINLTPQVYESEITLIDKDGQAQSPMELFRWTIPGPSGRIESVSLDKDYYSQGDQAQIVALVDPSMDLYWRQPPHSTVNPNAGTTLTQSSLSITLFDQNNQVCGQKHQDLPRLSDFQKTWGEVAVSLAVVKNCFNPRAEVKLIDSNQVLASANQTNPTSNPSFISGKQNRQEQFFIVGGLAIGLTVLLILLFILSRRKRPPTMPKIIATLLFIALICIGRFPNRVEATLSYISPPNSLNLGGGTCVDGYIDPYSNVCSPGGLSSWSDLITSFNGSVTMSGSTAQISVYGTPSVARYTPTQSGCSNNDKADVYISGDGITGQVAETWLQANIPWGYALNINNPPATLTYYIEGDGWHDTYGTGGSTYENDSAWAPPGCSYQALDCSTNNFTTTFASQGSPNCSIPDSSATCGNYYGAQDGKVTLSACYCPTDPSTLCTGTQQNDTCGKNVCNGTKVCDTTPPVISFYNNTLSCYDSTNWSTSPYSVNASDPDSGISSVTYEILNGSNQDIAGPTTVSNPTNPSSNLKPSPDFSLPAGGTYTVKITSSDINGNSATPITRSIITKSSCVAPFIQTQNGDVHSNQSINTPGGP